MSTTALVTALRFESRAVLAALATPRRLRGAARPSWSARVGAEEVVLVQAGVGRDAAHGALAALPARVTCLGSIGVVGALDPTLVPGDVVVPASLVWDEAGGPCRYDVEPALVEALCTAIAAVLPSAPRRATLLSSPTIVAGIAAKRAAYDRYTAAAVEMEAAALARHAAALGVTFFALRVVLDPADLSLEDLPPNLDASWVARARLATMPGLWPLLGTLRRHAATASGVLTRVVRAVLPVLAGGDWR